MKKITMRRRMISLTLAASVALPQVSSAFAASLWDEDGVSHKVAQAIESGQLDTQESAMPWVSLHSDDKSEQSTPTPEMPSMATESLGVTPTDGETSTPSSDSSETTTPIDGVDKITPSGEGDPFTPTEGVDKTPPTGDGLIIIPNYEATPSDGKSGEGELSSSTEEVAPTTKPADGITPDDGDGLLGDVPSLPGDQNSAGVTTPVPALPGSLDGEEASPSDEGEKADPVTGLTTSENAGGEAFADPPAMADTALSTDVNSVSAVMPFSSDLGPLTQWSCYRLGYGVQVRSSESKALTELDDHFAVESIEGGKTGPTYGYRDYSYFLTEDPFAKDYFGSKDEAKAWNPYSLCIFPSAEQLGRVPDKQFGGWYIYPSEAKAKEPAENAKNWYYGDLDDVADQFGTEDMKYLNPDELYKYEPGDLYYDLLYQNSSDGDGSRYGVKFGDLGDTWDGGRDYGYGYKYLRNDDGTIQVNLDDYGEEWIAVPGDGDVRYREPSENPVSFVAKWDPSDESRVRKVELFTTVNGKEEALPLYSDETYGNTVNFVTDNNDDGSYGDNGKSYEFWVRVPADADSISLDLCTMELYYDDYTGSYHDYSSYKLDTGNSHVTVTSTYGEETTTYTDDLSAQMLPEWSTMDIGVEIGVPGNSREYPAHSKWSVDGITVYKATGGNLYNDVVVTVTSPSGKETTTYTVHVQRLTDPTLTRAWGNTPIGMIRRDNGNLATTEAADKAEAYFEENRSFDSQTIDPTTKKHLYPNGSANQDGTVYRGEYSANAWLSATGDIDMDPTAIIAYLDSVFQDPGISLTGTIGEAVDLTKGTVSRSLRLKSVERLDPTQIGTDAGTECWYQNSALVTSSEPVFETLSLADGTDTIDLRGLNILPGVYTIEYRYTDPISGKSYGSDEKDYTEAGKASASAFRRTLVILPTPGDVDMDGAVTMADATTLKDLLSTQEVGSTIFTQLNEQDLADSDGNQYVTDPALALFAYRVCDINHDGVLDSKDIQLLRTLPNPKTVNEINASDSDYYYIPLPTGEDSEQYPRKRLTEETTDVPKLEMVYLGKEGGKFWSGDSGYMTDITGPWDAILPTKLPDGTLENCVELGDIFWLGVKLDNATVENLKLESVKSFTFTLMYDTRYVKPAVVLEKSEWEGIGSEEQLAGGWAVMMQKYNLNTLATGHTVWGDSPLNYEFTEAAGPGQRFTTHYSTAKMPLEDVMAESATEMGRLQSVTFSVEWKGGTTKSVLLQENNGEYLFALPFQMVRHPFGQQTARLVEFEAGMRSFTLVGISGSTYAYSSQDKIFGGTTKNLRDSLGYGNLGAEIPLGKDKTEVYWIYNWKHDGNTADSTSTVNGMYAEPFESHNGWTESGEKVDFTLNGALKGELPPGLTYHISAAYIDGVPETTGTYEFYIGNIPYRMVIDKAPLHFWSDSQNSYYGQPEFRNDASSDFTFKYAVDDIRSFEKERAAASGGSIVVNGDGAGLKDLLADTKYDANQPTFTAVTESGAAVTNATPVGTYQITNTLEPKATNYEFIYSYPEGIEGKMELTIMQRPIQIVHINGTAENPTVLGKPIYSDDTAALGQLTALRGTDVAADAVTFTARLAKSVEGADEEGNYNGYPLTLIEGYADGVVVPGDELEITFAARCVQTPEDIAEPGYTFALHSPEEYRDVRVASVRLTGGKGRENYRLVSEPIDPDEPVVPNAVVGKVLLRRILSMHLSQLPRLEWQYGDSFSGSNQLHFYLLLDGEAQEGEYRYSDTFAAKMGIVSYWATAEEKEAYEKGLDFDYEKSDKLNLEAGQILTGAYNGRYICLTTTTVDAEGNTVTIRCYGEKPLVVNPRTIVLTATPVRRFYGEENGTLTFTYDPKSLALIDQRDGLTGKGDELLDIFVDTEDNIYHYVAPKLEAVKGPMAPDQVTKDDRLTSKTEYTGSNNSVIIYGAENDNYQFLYTYTDGSGTTNRKDYGASTYKIERRPIVVEAVTKTEPLIEIYADTHRIYSDGQILRLEDLQMELPVHTENSTVYYNPKATSTASVNLNYGFAEGATAVVNGDDIYFTCRTTVIPTDGVEYAKYVDFARGYFNMEDVPEERGYKDYPVQINNLQLTGPDARNYLLVYKTPDRGKEEMPNRIEAIQEGTFRPEIPAPYLYYATNVLADGGYQRAIARVWLRPIKSMEIIYTGRTGYTYGETYDPSQGDAGSRDRQAMTIHIEYINDEKNNWAGNPTVGEVSFRTAGTHSDGQTYTTFEARSLKIYYVKDGQTAQQAIAAGQEISLNSALYVAEHNGTKLVVAGKRGDQENLIISQVTTATLRVEPKTLTLRGKDYQRVYGEANPAAYDFTFRAGDLARWDQATLGLTDAFATVSGARLSELSNLAYTAPKFGTAATPGSDVLNGGRDGYAITNLTKGELENYTLQYEPGTLYIYPRTVNIQRFISSGDNPIYTIFSDVEARIFFTNVTTNVDKDSDGKPCQPWAQFEVNRASYGYILEDGTMLPSTGAGLYPGDEMRLRIKVHFPSDLKLDSAQAQGNIDVTVEDAELVAGTRAASNYVLQMNGSGSSAVASIANGTAIGRVELRNITTIEIESIPTKMEYTYGEALDLTGLAIKIHYNTGSGSGTNQTTLVYYMGTDQFAEYGLHVNYYDSATLKAGESIPDINESYRDASTGDHLTIAPTHDAQLPGAKLKNFSANGKYLIITAQRHKNQAASQPVIVQTPIKVNPLPIEFTLSAEDKIYNGNTQAAGTITFTNIFNKSGVVDSLNRNGVTDLVYPVTDADYEEKWGSGYSRKDNFQYFNEYVKENGYSFTTGRYVANDPSIFAENKTLDWTAGYKYGAAGTLTFSYLDPNVAYAQTPEHDVYGDPVKQEVQVTGLRLAGPDAANYTLVGKAAGETVAVTTANASTAQGYLGKTAGLPTATIRKANRAGLTTDLIPQVEIDPHTNVVRVNYDQSLSAITGGEEKAHADELHFEFALQKVLTGTADSGEDAEDVEELTVTDVIQWAGKSGEYEWDDFRYFGGETAPMTGLEITTDVPEAGEYVPREEDIPKAESINENTTLKGQVYQWKELDDGFALDLSAYPGGVYWPGYELYATDRTALDRDTIYLAVIRAAETNNYNASPALSSVEGYTSAMIQAILDAQNAKKTAATGAAYEKAQQDYEQAVQAASEPLLQAVLEAQEAAQAEVDTLMAAGEKGNKLEERPVRAAAGAVKTYKQVIETVSVKAYQGASEDKNKKGDAYQVPTLEAIWFTDIEEIPSKEVLDAVVWNTNPTRYRRYGYDSGFVMELKLTEGEPLSLREPKEIEIPVKGEDTPKLIRFNEDSNARFYVDTTFPNSGGNVNPDLMVIRPSGIMALLGDAPVTLEAVFYPAWTRPSVVQWSSSDPTVAVVDNMGRVSFVGVGTAVITAIVPGGYSGAEPVCSASIMVTVVEDWKKDYPNSIFDFGNQDAFLVSGTGTGDGDKLFKPEMGITRGETAKLLSQFYVSNPSWSKRGPEEFTDLTGEEDYAEAAKLLGHLGVFMGYPEGDFAGEQYISRAEFVTLLARMTGLSIVDTAGQAHAFLDTGEEDTWAYAEIDALSRQTGILYGVGEGYFAPDRNITRSEVAALLVRLLRFPVAQNKELIVPIDVDEEHWARECILRAVNGSHVVETNLLWDEP